MKSITYKIMVLCIVLALGTNLMAQKTDVRIEVLLLNYLTGYCDEGEKNTFIDFIQNNAQTVEPLLINYVREGVPEKLVDSLETTLIRQYDDRQKLLSENLDFGLSKEDLDFVKNESQEGFRRRMVQEFRDGFMSQAIFGLSLISSKEAQALIKQIATDKNHPYQRSAKNAVNQIYLKRK